jgi:hypothetical protein
VFHFTLSKFNVPFHTVSWFSVPFRPTCLFPVNFHHGRLVSVPILYLFSPFFNMLPFSSLSSQLVSLFIPCRPAFPLRVVFPIATCYTAPFLRPISRLPHFPECTVSILDLCKSNLCSAGLPRSTLVTSGSSSPSLRACAR